MRALDKLDKLTDVLSSFVHEMKEDRKQWQDERMGARVLAELNKSLCELKCIMATQAELVADLKAASNQLRKLVADTQEHQASIDALKAKIVELEAIIAAGGTIGPELVEAVAEVKTLTQAVDDNVPEVPTPPPVA